MVISISSTTSRSDVSQLQTPALKPNHGCSICGSLKGVCLPLCVLKRSRFTPGGLSVWVGVCWEGCTEAVMELLAQNLVGPRVLGRPLLLPVLSPLGGSAGPWSGQMVRQAKVASLFEFYDTLI